MEVAHLLHPETRERFPLSPSTLVGRGPQCQVQLTWPNASGPHAILQWSEAGWAIRDLDSKNGTFVDGVCLPRAGARLLSAGARLGFGGPEQSLILEDVVPALYAVEVRSRRVCFAERGLLSLAGEAGGVAVWQDADGLVLESQGETSRLSPDDVVEVSGERWRVYPAPMTGGTQTTPSGALFSEVTLRFLVNPAEEVRLEVIDRGHLLGAFEQEHYYVLLLLARERRRAESAGGEGWVEHKALLKQLKMAQGALDTAIYRIRQGLLGLGLDGAEKVVEVGRGQKRLGTRRFSLETLEQG
jgi:hypothetical protein